MSPIAIHFECLMSKEVQEEVGCLPDKPEALRVMRLLAAYDELRAEAARLKATCDELVTDSNAITLAANLAEKSKEVARLREALENAMMHLCTNYDIDGNSMNESDAADVIRAALAGEGGK